MSPAGRSLLITSLLTVLLDLQPSSWSITQSIQEELFIQCLMGALCQKMPRAEGVNWGSPLEEPGSGAAQGPVLRCGPPVLRCSQRARTPEAGVARAGFLEGEG